MGCVHMAPRRRRGEKPAMWLLLAFLLVPMIEIALFIKVGGLIGLWPTLGIVVGTAILGSMLVRSQGGQALGRIRGAVERRQDPSSHLADGAMIIFSGALLLTPGFFTDALGFALLIPGVRAAIRRYVSARMVVQTQSFHTRETRHPGGVTIDAEYEEVTPPRTSVPPSDKPGNSGWTRS